MRCAVPAGGRRPADPFFVPDAAHRSQKQALCWRTGTNPQVHELIRENLRRSPMYSGAIPASARATAPPSRTRPSVRRQGRAYDLPRARRPGLGRRSTSTASLRRCPEDVQLSNPLARPGPRRLRACCGRVTRSSTTSPSRSAPPDARDVRGRAASTSRARSTGPPGYEEAAAQGLWAGVNAALAVTRRGAVRAPAVGGHRGRASMSRRPEAARHSRSPHRLFTSRAEHRLLLGVDSALRPPGPARPAPRPAPERGGATTRPRRGWRRGSARALGRCADPTGTRRRSCGNAFAKPSGSSCRQRHVIY